MSRYRGCSSSRLRTCSINDFGVPEIVPVEFGGTLGAETQE